MRRGKRVRESIQRRISNTKEGVCVCLYTHAHTNIYIYIHTQLIHVCINTLYIFKYVFVYE